MTDKPNPDVLKAILIGIAIAYAFNMVSELILKICLIYDR